MNRTSLLFIGITPPETISKEITLLKEEIGRRFRTSHALKSPPHITLQAPFIWPSGEDQTLYRLLTNFAASQKRFNTTLAGFGSFDKRVVFIKIADHHPLLILHHNFLDEVTAKLPPEPSKTRHTIHPHITLATRDIDEKTFDRIEHFLSDKSFSAQCTFDSIVLFRHHDKKWENCAEFFFDSN